MSERQHVLIVEDNPADADLIRDAHDAITAQDVDGGHVSPFERIRRMNETGMEFWSSRDFAGDTR
jgi:hypothetical protein